MKSILVVAAIGVISGCALETTAPADEATFEAKSHIVGQNALQPNGLAPNGLAPNGLAPNGLAPNSLSPSALATLQDPTEVGTTARMFVEYAVGCAFNTEQSFSL